jgi:hypothetical protein
MAMLSGTPSISAPTNSGLGHRRDRRTFRPTRRARHDIGGITTEYA